MDLIYSKRPSNSIYNFILKFIWNVIYFKVKSCIHYSKYFIINLNFTFKSDEDLDFQLEPHLSEKL